MHGRKTANTPCKKFTIIEWSQNESFINLGRFPNAMNDEMFLRKHLCAIRKLERKLDDVNRELSRMISKMKEKDQEF